MPSKSETQTSQQSSSQPWEPTIPLLGNIIGQIGGQSGGTGITAKENAALGGLEGLANRNAGNLRPGVTPLPSGEMPGSPGYDPNNPQNMGGLLNNLWAGGGMGASAGLVNDAYKNLQGTLNPIAQGNFVDPTTNPYLQKSIALNNEGITNQVNSIFGGAGRDLSGAHLGALGKGISDSTVGTYTGAYENERNRQMGAANTLFGGALSTSGALEGMAGQKLGAQLQAPGLQDKYNESQAAPYMQQLQVEAMRRGMPLQNIGMLSQLLLPIAQLGKQQQGTGTSSTEGDPWSNIFKGFSVATPFLCDRRLKDDIIQVGTLFDGTPIYRFRYKGTPIVHIGVMAQDIEKTIPEAVSELGGVKMVDYDLVTKKWAA